jgi:hypothetical protein
LSHFPLSITLVVIFLSLSSFCWYSCNRISISSWLCLERMNFDKDWFAMRTIEGMEINRFLL